jgi:hypothetical protein
MFSNTLIYCISGIVRDSSKICWRRQGPNIFSGWAHCDVFCNNNSGKLRLSWFSYLYSILAARANTWLKTNWKCHVISIQTLDIYPKHGCNKLRDAVSNWSIQSLYYMAGENNDTYSAKKLVGLRWVVLFQWFALCYKLCWMYFIVVKYIFIRKMIIFVTRFSKATMYMYYRNFFRKFRQAGV